MKFLTSFRSTLMAAFLLLIQTSLAVDCECYDADSNCLDTTQWSTLCNLNTVNYAVVACVAASSLIALSIDHVLYKSVEI